MKTPLWGDSKADPSSSSLPIVAALVFAVHPLQTQAVTYIWQRTASLCALFYLSALFFQLQALLTEKPRFYRWLSFAAAIAALFSKQNAFTLPLALLLQEYFFFGRTADSGSFRWRISTLLLLFVTPLTSFVLGDLELRIIQELPAGKLTAFEYLLTQCHVLWTYLRLLFFPIGQNFDYDYPLTRHLDVATIICGAGLLSLLGSAGWLYRRHRVLSFGILLFFLALAVESSLVPLEDVIEEHRLYLPLAAFALAAAYGLEHWRVNKGLVLGIILIFTFLTFERNKVYATQETLWLDVIRKSPRKFRAYTNLGAYYSGVGKYVAANDILHQALAINPGDAKALYNLGLMHFQLEEWQKARTYFERSLEINPHTPEAYYNLGGVFLKTGNSTLAQEHFLHAQALGYPVPAALLRPASLQKPQR